MSGQLGLSVTAFGNIERGGSCLSVERLEQVAGVMPVSIKQLLTLAEACLLSGEKAEVAALDPAGFRAALRAQEQLVHSLLAKIDHLRS